ncbi:hypothetical protein GSI_01251 [Ganoderma sinense ZZ0214-1]|uniref:Ubiquitin 3 binding protein But2 C-terminal domain-containing protein n=1 Tax=Ganoderma sinense ZZ0214-1 TaxID=1077348 RepID=A0A2G8SUW6_9APHY|nr:hypothetical protein GSI_01251 [Ganoderma sinense ZZ0214-1]
MIFQSSSPASSSSSAYAPLLHSDPDSQDDIALLEHDVQSKERPSEEQRSVTRRLSPMVYWACALSLLCSAFNISLLGLNVLSPQASPSPSPPLEYGNSYVGLEAAVRDPSAPPLRPITTFPTGIAQVNESDPRAVYYDVHRWASTFGTVYPEDRRVLSSSTESTYIQFWAGDFGMERCALKLLLPGPSSESPHDVVLPTPDAALQIWHVDTSRGGGLDFHRLSWRSRPARGALLASWILRDNATLESEVFRCPSGSFQAFELGCAGKGCRVDFRQTPKRKDLGFWLVQRPSI